MKAYNLCLLLLSIFAISWAQSCTSINGTLVDKARLPNNFCAYYLFSNLNQPRGLHVVSNGDILVLESGLEQVTVLYDSNHDGTYDGQAKLAGADGLNHAVVVHEGYLYASSPTAVYRWAYTPGQRSDLGTPQQIIQNIPCCHHTTRSLIFDSEGLLYVQSGSEANVAADSSHSRIARFPVANFTSVIDWSSGEVFADGLRNEVGLRFDLKGRLWGVENGCDDLYRDDLGGDIHENNPSEEMNLFEAPGQFYGYPYCWSEYKLPHNVPGTQYVHPNFMQDGVHSDSWCQSLANVKPPKWNFQAHMAPLDIIFSDDQVLPKDFQGGAFVSFHGSWDRDPPVGYRVDFVQFDPSTYLPVASAPFFSYDSDQANGPDWPHRPVALGFGPCLLGTCLLVTSDQSGAVIAIGYDSK